MADVTLEASISNNGTATPATSGSITTSAGSLLIQVIAVLGTSPTIGLPTNMTQAQLTNGAALSVGLFYRLNCPSGAKNPSSVLGGTVTGWVSTAFSFTATGANEGLLASFQSALAVAQLTNIFAGNAQPASPLLFMYSVARATATITPTLTGPNWSASVQPQAGVQGLSLDFYWASTQNTGVGPPYATASGLLSGAVNSVSQGAMFNSAASIVTANNSIGGNAGVLVASGGPAPIVGGSPTAINSGYGGEVPGPTGSGAFFSGMIGG